MKINKLLGIVVLGLLLSANGYTQSVDFAVNISKPGSTSSILGSDLTIEIVDPGSISSILGDAKQIKITDNSIFSADKTICITNAKGLDAETLKILKLID